MKPIHFLPTLAAALGLGAGPVLAGLVTVPVAENVYALVGGTGQRSPENLGNNATFGVVVTDAGVALIDAGGSAKGAAEIEAAIRAITDKPVVLVVDTGGQDHRWMGNDFWLARGARVVASADAAADQAARASVEMTMLSQLIGPSLDGTDPVPAPETFDESLKVDLGGTEIEIIHPGPAHTPGDSFVWLPDRKVAFTGDIVFHERLLGVLEVSNSAGWVAAFEAMASKEPAHVVPGHGNPTTLDGARADTYDYLVHLRGAITAHIEAGGDIIAAPGIDQSAFARLEGFDTLAGRNAQQVFSEMEWE